MVLFKKAEDIQLYLQKVKKQGLSIGFMPTMGALHQGHISLLKKSKKSRYVTVVSIFVNPTQFNNSKDFDNYPSSLENDIDELEKAGCDALFLPSVAEMYPHGTINSEPYDLGYLETVLEGKYRPGHFQGVCQVVHRLLNIVRADHLYLGQKDYQQCMVIKKLIELTQIKTSIVICPTLREADGLAMSSRNIRLSDKERKKASKIFETLSGIKNQLKPGRLEKLKERSVKKLRYEGFKVDYVEIADANTLEILNDWNGKTAVVALTAVFLNEVRLIDNMLL